MKLELLRKTDLALRALRHLAGARGRVSAGELAEEIGSTMHYLPQVMAPLVARGWVNSSRGPGGGYEMMVDVDDVSMLGLIEAVEGPIDERCVLRPRPCPGSPPCAVHDAWTQARDVLLTELDHIRVMSQEVVTS